MSSSSQWLRDFGAVNTWSRSALGEFKSYVEKLAETKTGIKIINTAIGTSMSFNGASFQMSQADKTTPAVPYKTSQAREFARHLTKI